MPEKYVKGLAFIFEGATEKVFYHTMLEYFVGKHCGYSLNTQINGKTGESFDTISFEDKKILVMFNNVGTITQVTHSGEWFKTRCYERNKGLRWTVFLCYDTDSYQNNITKFHEGDWNELRKTIQKCNDPTIIDLAAKADIEDIMLSDAEGVFKYLEIEPIQIPKRSNGKNKMRQIFRTKGRGYTYHEGKRAEPLIKSLNMEKIISSLPEIPFCEIESEFENAFSSDDNRIT